MTVSLFQQIKSNLIHGFTDWHDPFSVRLCGESPAGDSPHVEGMVLPTCLMHSLRDYAASPLRETRLRYGVAVSDLLHPTPASADTSYGLL